MVDANPNFGGSLSYTTQEEGVYKRQRWGLGLSSLIAEKSSVGVNLRKGKDEDSSLKTTKKYYQTVFGVTHIVDEKFTVGLVAIDPFKSKAHETKAILGLQYGLLEFITGMVDFGGDYTSDEISKTLIYKGAVQVKVLDDFFLRFGGFNDKLRKEKGNGFGLSWMSPRLALDFAIKNTKRSRDAALGITDANFKETSFAASLKF